MRGINFQVRPPVADSHPNRADIACFAGFVRRRNGRDLPAELNDWFMAQGWRNGPYARPLSELTDVPVPIDSWNVFDALFEWERREPVGNALLGAAVRSYFAQGGRKCYVVRAGDPWSLTAPRQFRVTALSTLIPGYPGLFAASPADRANWHGIAHLFGLTDVSFLCLPDLVDAVALDRGTVAVDPPAPPSSPEIFVPCSTSEAAPPGDDPALPFAAPQCDEGGFREWGRAVGAVKDVLAAFRREVQFVAALPRPASESASRSGLPALVQQSGVLDSGSAFVQIAFPWVRTPGSSNMPERLESPDGVLAGVLARNAMMNGAFESAAGLHLADSYDLDPMLNRHDSDALQQHLSVFGRTPDGWQLLSDVTTSRDETYRPACVNRLVSVIVRAARVMGEGMTFEPSNERLWARIRDRMGLLMKGLYQAGALDGATPQDAYQIRCDRSTMSQNDIDNGRVLVEIRFQPSAPIESITVVLALSEGGQASLAAPPAQEAAA